MLPPFIIEQIKKREEEAKIDRRPVLDLPLPQHPRRPTHNDSEAIASEHERTHDRGVVVIDL